METFEIHITGSDKIHSVGAKLNVKTIAIDLLKPDLSVLRTEHMTSFVQKHDNFYICYDVVEELVAKFKKQKVDIYRVKIECPYIPRYSGVACYIESHFVTKDVKYPVSRNQNKKDMLATVRLYGSPDKYFEEYSEFANKWKKEVVELCLHDTFANEDLDWFELWS